MEIFHLDEHGLVQLLDQAVFILGEVPVQVKYVIDAGLALEIFNECFRLVQEEFLDLLQREIFRGQGKHQELLVPPGEHRVDVELHVVKHAGHGALPNPESDVFSLAVEQVMELANGSY